MRWLVAVVALGACYSPASLSCEIRCANNVCPNGLTCVDGRCAPIGGTCGPAGPDGPDGDSGPLDDCFGVDEPPFLRVCKPAGTLSPSDGEVETSLATDTDCTFVVDITGAPDLCVVVADQLTISAGTKVRATGTNALVLIGRRELTIAGTLDVAGHRDDAAGTVNPPAVGSCPLPGTSINGGGGPGGAYRGNGGDGGAGSDNGVVPGPLSTPPQTLRGGCAGGRGGSSNMSSATTPPGDAGGAVYLLGNKIAITGTINASGGGARIATMTTGGGGGGSGGMILMWGREVVDIAPTAAVFALGGGGGTGGGVNSIGLPGNDPNGPNGGAAAVTGDAAQGDGGRGGDRSNDNGAPGGVGSGGGGGGGGGGGNGYILIRPVPSVTPPNVAPSPT